MVNKINQSQNREILEHYVKVGEVIAEMFAPNLEVIIHDLQTPEHSIIAIFNNHITGRKIGDGTSDIGYKKLEDELPDKIVNYNNQSPSGSDLKSSSLTIRNSDDEIIGSMGLNFDLSSFVNIKEFLEMFTETFTLDNLPKREEFFMWSVKDEIQQALNKYIASHDLQGKVLNRKDKLNVVAYMKKEGHINKKGAISILSEMLAITRPTLYKYIKEV
jgi:predicted transcriptional regulator YheO|tara:strand:- start:429 stop:1079 length:651 start_codon:yes stop_codon:yes gene_type:complete